MICMMKNPLQACFLDLHLLHDSGFFFVIFFMCGKLLLAYLYGLNFLVLCLIDCLFVSVVGFNGGYLISSLKLLNVKFISRCYRLIPSVLIE